MAGPSLELDWELGLFKALRALWRGLGRAEAPVDTTSAARLADHHGRWTWLACALAGRSVRLLPAKDRGGVRGDDLLLPESIDLGPDAEVNRGLYVLRIAIDATTCARSPHAPTDPQANAAASRAAALESVEILSRDLAGFAHAYAEARKLLPPGDDGPLWGRLVPCSSGESVAGAPDAEPPAPGATHREAPPVEDIEVVALDEEKIAQMPIHSFEKVEMAESFSGTMRQLDGEDELDAQLEALEEVDLKHLVRGGPQAHSVYHADIALDAQVPHVDDVASDEPAILTDEWDVGLGAWRRGWCRVIPSGLPSEGSDAWAREALRRHRRTVEQLTDRLLVHRSERAIQHRQADGDEVDLDAVVDALGTMRAGRDPSPRLYDTRPRARRDVATTVLLDVSLSADAWVDNRRVLDVSREAVLVLGEVAERLGDRLQVLAFASRTRHRVRVWTVRDWHEPWSRARTRLGRLAPQGYTRIGAALRHATDRLCDAEARERVLILVSDGKPTDWDKYEGRYGVADVRMALGQARSRGVHVHALAVDAVARDYLPAMLGPGAWDVLPHPGALPDALARVYARLT